MNVREYLYRKSHLKPVFDPVEIPKSLPDPYVVDLSIDALNHFKINHTQTDAVRSLITNADAVVCDNEILAWMAKKYNKGLVVAFPFGFTTARDMPDEKGVRLGLLNQTFEQRVNNEGYRDMLKGLGFEFLVYGEGIDGLDCEPVPDLDAFVSFCDILLLPSLETSNLNSLALPLSAIMAGTIVLYHNRACYSFLDNGSGCFPIEVGHTDAAWGLAIEKLLNNMGKMDTLKGFNRRWSTKVSSRSLDLVNSLQVRLGITKTQVLPEKPKKKKKKKVNTKVSAAE